MIEGFSDKLPGFDLAVTFPKYINVRPQDVHNSLSFHSLQSCKFTDGFPFSYGGLCGGLGPMMGLIIASFIVRVQLARACGLGFGYLPVVTWIHCQCQPESWNGRGFIPCFLDMFLHGRGHKFCCVHLVTLYYLFPAPSLQARVASQPSARKTMCFYNEMYDLKEGFEIIDKKPTIKSSYC